MKSPCVVNLHNNVTVSQEAVGRRLTRLSEEKMRRVCEAILYSLSYEAIRTIVATGDFLSKDAERYLADTVIRRRERILDHYFRQ
jgi:hypothetical protein